MSDPIVVTGANLWDIKAKLGIPSTPDYSIHIAGYGDRPKVLDVRTPNASRRFTSPQQAIQFLRTELLANFRREKKAKEKLKKQLKRLNKGSVNRQLTRPSSRRRRNART